MADDLKTKPTKQSVKKFLASGENPQRRADAIKVCELMQDITKQEPVLCGPSIVGFGRYHYVYASGREGDWMQVGFSPRKSALTLYIMSGFSDYAELMKNLGKYKTGKSCLYLKKLEDIDIKVLQKLIRESINYIKKKYITKGTN